MRSWFVLLSVIGFSLGPISAHSADGRDSSRTNSASCFSDAKVRAKDLLLFYSKPDSRGSVGEPREIKPRRSPDGKRKYRVLEVPGFIYKSQYRIRMIYATLADDPCLLMGEEILDLSRL